MFCARNKSLEQHEENLLSLVNPQLAKQEINISSKPIYWQERDLQGNQEAKREIQSMFKIKVKINKQTKLKLS